MAAAKSDCVQQLVQSLIVDAVAPKEKDRDYINKSPYLLLMQHSQSFHLRQEQQHQQQHSSTTAGTTTTATDVSVYRRAGLRTPQENAATDWQAGGAWMEHLAVTVLNVSVPLESTTTALLCLQTLPTTTKSSCLFQHMQTTYGYERVQIVDCCGKGSGGPFGWDDDDASGGGIMNLERLDSVIGTVVSKLQSVSKTHHVFVLLLDSIAPLLVRHGLRNTATFLRRLQDAFAGTTSASTLSCCPLLVVPILSETLTARQHRSLEDASNAVLSLHGGEAGLLRQGVRERGNMVRESLRYRIIVPVVAAATTSPSTSRTTRDTRRTIIEPLSTLDVTTETTTTGGKAIDHQVGAGAAAAIAVSSLAISSDNSDSDVPSPTRAPQPRRGKVNLQVDEGGRDLAVADTVVETTTSQPNIFMQDDDPEFDDFDEEDPDDDLDL